MKPLNFNDINAPITIKLDKSIKVNGGVMLFGEKNDYPQTIERLILNSKTASASKKIYSRFLAGQGFENEQINSIVVGRDNKGKDITLRKLLNNVCNEIAMFNGFYIHTKKNILNKIKEVRPVSFKYCRFPKIDSNQYCANVLVYENWEKDKAYLDSDGKSYDTNKVKAYYIFSSLSDVFKQRIKDETIEEYKGEIYFNFFDNSYLYPLSPFDSVFLDMDTENQISIFKNNTVRNGFFDKSIVRIGAQTSESDMETIVKQLQSMMGVGGSQVAILQSSYNINTGEINKDIAVDQIKSTINTDLFSNWESSLTNNIRTAPNAIPALLIDYEQGKLSSTSGESIIQATNYYNSMVLENQMSISESFEELFSNFDNNILKDNTNWKIKQLNLYNNGTNPTNNANTATNN